MKLDYEPMPKYDPSGYDVQEDLADYAAQRAPKWLGAVLLIQAFVFGGLAWALLERWVRS